MVIEFPLRNQLWRLIASNNPPNMSIIIGAMLNKNKIFCAIILTCALLR